MQWLGSDWQVDRTPSSPISLHIHTSVHTHTHPSSCFVFRFLRKKSLVRVSMWRNTSPHLQTGTQSLQEQWEVTKVIFQLQHSPDGHAALSFVAKNLHVSHSTQGVTQSVNQCEALDFVKWLLRFLSHLLWRYTRYKIKLSQWGNTEYKSQPSWHSCPVLEEARRKHSWVGLIQPDWMSAFGCLARGIGHL